MNTFYLLKLVLLNCHSYWRISHDKTEMFFSWFSVTQYFWKTLGIHSIDCATGQQVFPVVQKIHRQIPLMLRSRHFQKNSDRFFGKNIGKEVTDIRKRQWEKQVKMAPHIHIDINGHGILSLIYHQICLSYTIFQVFHNIFRQKHTLVKGRNR